jgi:hypothetical protein
MVRAVVQHVTSLAEAPEIAEPVVRGVAVQVRGCEHDARLAKSGGFNQVRPSRGTAAPIAPRSAIFIEPAPVWQTTQRNEVRTAAPLASAACALETHSTAKLAPVRWIEGAQLGSDRHDYAALCLPSTR